MERSWWRSRRWRSWRRRWGSRRRIGVMEVVEEKDEEMEVEEKVGGG